MAASGGGAHGAGIRGTIVVANSLDTAVLERDTSGAFGSAVEVARFSGAGTYDWEDNIAVNGVSYYYRVKAVRTGYVDSSYTASSPTNGKPTVLSGPA